MANESSLSRAATTRGRAALVFAALLWLDFFVVLVMLVTDRNLQTDFGAVSPYYLHWYAGLALAIVTVLFAIMIPATARASSPSAGPARSHRLVLVTAEVWSWVAVLGLVGVLATYRQVGFSTPSQFSMYLFGLSRYPGTLSYIPGLYDVVLGLFVISAVMGAIAVARSRGSAQSVTPWAKDSREGS
jgi:hypothetical protein